MDKYIKEKINKRFEYLDRNLDDDQNPIIYYITKKSCKKFLKLVNFKYSENEFIGVDNNGRVCIETRYPDNKCLHVTVGFNYKPFSHCISIYYPYKTQKCEDKHEKMKFVVSTSTEIGSLSKITEIYKREMY